MGVSKQPVSGIAVGRGSRARRHAFATACAVLLALALALWIARRPSDVARESQAGGDALSGGTELRSAAPSALNKPAWAVRSTRPHLRRRSDDFSGAAGSGLDDPDAGARLRGSDVPEGADRVLLEGIADELRMSIEEERQAPAVVIEPATR